MDMREFAKNNRLPIIFTAVFMLLVAVAYAVYGQPAEMGESPSEGISGSTGVYNGIQYKVAFTPTGEMKIFALAKNNELALLKASEGKGLPETNSMVLGATEAEMMRKEGLFSKPGDSLTGFFGIDTRIEGILERTGQPLDMFHFMSQNQFERIQGTQGRIFSRLTKENVPKIFYTYEPGKNQPIKLALAERSVGGFEKTTIGSEVYCPVIVGSEEAKMMREESLFVHAGDTIKGFFGNNIFIAGVLEETGTSMDNFHLVTPDCEYN